jgi:hypothetical protein
MPTHNSKQPAFSRAAVPAAVIFLCLSVAFFSPTAAPQKKSAAPSAPSVFTPDKGKFAVQLDGQTVGHEEFEISPSADRWAAHGTTDLKPPGSASSHVTGSLTLRPDGAPIAYEWTAHTDKTNGAHIAFENGLAKITLQMEGARPYEQTLSFGTPIIAVLDNNLYYQYAVLARIYDWTKGGAQDLPVLIPQELTPGSIKLESTGSTTANGKSYEGLRVSTSDLQVLLYLDATHRLMRLEVPAAKVSVSRE